MRAVIFGVSGQDAFYLRDLLLSEGYEVIGVSRSAGQWIQGSVADNLLVGRLMKELKPDFVFHLAANSSTQHKYIWENHEAVATGSLNILEAVKMYSSHSKVFLTGSGLQFVNRTKPIDEGYPFSATSPYVVCRNQSVYAARYYRSLGIKVYVGYLFNHESPRRPLRHVSQMVCTYCNSIKFQKKKLEIGDLTVMKEWTFAGDTVKGIWTLVNQDEIHECVIGSGSAYSLQDWVETCFKKVGEDWTEHVIQKSDFVSEYTALVSKPDLIRTLGWNIQVSFDGLAEMMINL